ncbi:uncharacterized protein LOC126737856 isoform X2 [Anthonomus grandis grandis]|uniref:uncharacterized protein LOC126737856 isoform X2 n=1 Tax=Anthonomus grandis grandis TaxID=2921223 RepID=UPI00216590B3|nr:uncharacterized protein LOC126737856 isoform X2 [Anthonomus grandis grandis]
MIFIKLILSTNQLHQLTTTMNVESTFIFESVDRKKLSNKLLVVMLKNLFKFGKKDIKIVQGRVHLYLSYSPRNETVAQKVKGLPGKYLRVAASDEEELQLFLKAMREFTEVNFYQAIELEEDEHHALTDNRDKEEPNKKKIEFWKIEDSETLLLQLDHPN